MKLSNFRDLKITGTNILNKRAKATVDVTTGFILKQTEAREITRVPASCWRFSDTGEFAPDVQAETLSHVYCSKLNIRDIWDA